MLFQDAIPMMPTMNPFSHMPDMTRVIQDTRAPDPRQYAMAHADIHILTAVKLAKPPARLESGVLVFNGQKTAI